MPTNQEVRELAKELSAKWDGALVDLMEMAMQKVLVFDAEKQEAAQPATSLFQRDTAEVSCGDAAGGTATGNNYCRTLRYEGTEMIRLTENDVVGMCREPVTLSTLTRVLNRVLTDADTIRPAAEPEKPVWGCRKPKTETLDRTHQWFKDDTVSALLPGPVVLSKDGLHCITTSEGDISFSEQNIIDGALVRIPPPPPGVDLEGWDCRKPVRGDRYHPLNGDGTSRGYTSEAPGCCWDDPIFGMNRWIEPPQPAKRPWPVGPFKVFPHNDSDKLYYVQGQGYIVAVQCTKADAAAIAKSLDVVPRFADWAINRCMIAPQEGRDLVAELAAAGFKMPKL